MDPKMKAELDEFYQVAMDAENIARAILCHLSNHQMPPLME